jgi:hypothetical protein
MDGWRSRSERETGSHDIGRPGTRIGAVPFFLPPSLPDACPILGRAFEWEEDASIKGE